MMSERREGWYWVFKNGSWEVCLFQAGYWLHSGDDNDSTDGDFNKIGDRIPTPGEMEGWQVVPDVASNEMLSEAVFSYERGSDKHNFNLTQLLSNAYEDMLQAAPKPGDV